MTSIPEVVESRAIFTTRLPREQDRRFVVTRCWCEKSFAKRALLVYVVNRRNDVAVYEGGMAPLS